MRKFRALLWLLLAAIAVISTTAHGQPASQWDERETRLANEYLALLVERPEQGKVLDLLWDLYAKHDATRFLIENIRAQAKAVPHAATSLVEALLAWKGGDLAAAAALFDQVLAKEPTNRFALRGRADLADAQGKPDEAARLLRRLLAALPENDPSKPSTWLELGSLLQSSGKTTEAAEAWEAAAKLRPNDLDMARLVAQWLLQAGLPARATVFFEELAKQAEPQKKLDALRELARIRGHADQFPQADQALVEALGLLHFRDGRYQDFFRERARLHERFGALDELRAKLLVAARKQPPEERALADLAAFYEITVEPDERIVWLRALMKAAPAVDEYRWQLVRELLDHDGAAEAAKLIDERLQGAGAGAGMPAVALLRCEADLRLGASKEAVARLKKLLTQKTGDEELEKQVLLFAQDKALDEIVEEILKARVKREPDKSDAVFELATHYRSHRQEEALDKLLRDYLSPRGSELDQQRRSNEAAAFAATGKDVDAAIIAARRAAKQPLSGREEQLRLADLLIEQAETEEAMNLLEDCWRNSTTFDERADVDERALSLLLGEQKKADALAGRNSQGDGFQIPAIFSGANFGSDEETPGKEAPVPKALIEHARRKIADANETTADETVIIRGVWWAYRAELLDEAYRLLRRVIINPDGSKRKDVPVEIERMTLDLAVASQNKALMERQLRLLADRDPANRVRYQLRLSELVMESRQLDDSVLRSNLSMKSSGSRASPLTEAVAILENALRENPGTEMLLAALTQVYTLMREPEKALRLWEDAAARADGARAIPLLTRQAELLLRLQRLQDYIGVQVSIIERETEVKRRRELFKGFMDRLLFTDASGGELAPTVLADRLKMVEQAVQERARRHPFDGFYHEALAQVHERHGDPVKAFAEMRQAYYTTPDAPFSLDQLRAAALRAGDLKSAIYFQKQIAAAAPAKEQATESRQLVELLEQTFQINEADRVRRRLESRFAQDAKALEDLAAHYKATGQDEAERRVYEQIVKVSPWDARARLRLARKCLALADELAAEKELRQLIASTPPLKLVTAVERWPLPLTDARRDGNAGPVMDVIDLLVTASGLEAAEIERLRAWLSYPRPELTALPQDAGLVRLRGIEELGRLLRERSGEDCAAWIADWQRNEKAPVIEKLWAYFYSGAREEFQKALFAAVGAEESLDLRFAQAWLLLRSQNMAAALDWANRKERADEVLRVRKRLLIASVSMLAKHEEFRFEPQALALFGASQVALEHLVRDISNRLEGMQRYEEALALSESRVKNPAEANPRDALVIARLAGEAERRDLQRRYLESVVSSPSSAPATIGLFDPFLSALESLQRAGAGNEEGGTTLPRVWRQLQQAPAAPHTELRRTAVTGLAGATERAAADLERFISGDFVSSRQIGERADTFMTQATTRYDESMHLHTFWQDTREIAGHFNQQGLGDVIAAADERLDAKWGGVQLGPRGGHEFNQWRLNLLLRRMREADHPTRLRLMREHLASVDMRAETAVDALAELGGLLEANLMPREAVEVYRRLPERAPTNSEYAAWVLRACENARMLEPGKSFAIQMVLAEPPYKPVSIGDETLREKHALFLALDQDADELQRRGFVEQPTKVLQGRIPPEVPYLRELALLMERRGEDARALAAWERMHAAFVSNADKGLEPDEENCLHRARILDKQGDAGRALAALRELACRGPLSANAAAALMLRGSLAARQGLWDEVRELMLIAVDRKAVDVVLSLAGDLRQHGRAADALSFLTQAERVIKTDAGRFRLRLDQLKLLAADSAWNPSRGHPQIASLFRVRIRERALLEGLMTWLGEQAGGRNAGGWIAILRAEVKSGADPLLAAAALGAFAAQMPEGPLPSEFASTWQQADDADRICLDLATTALLACKRPAWAWAVCQAAAAIPSSRQHSRKLPAMARVAAALSDEHALAELFTDLMRLEWADGGQVVEWARAFEDAARPDLARELFISAQEQMRQRQTQQPAVFKAWVELLLRQRDFEAAEAALVRQHYLVVTDAAALIFALYRDWDKLSALDSELPKFFMADGIEKEVRFLAQQHLDGKAPALKNPTP